MDRQTVLRDDFVAFCFFGLSWQSCLTWDCFCENPYLRIIFVEQTPARTTELQRKNGLGIIYALADDHQGNGRLFWDDGNSIDTITNEQYTLLTFTGTKVHCVYLHQPLKDFTAGLAEHLFNEFKIFLNTIFDLQGHSPKFFWYKNSSWLLLRIRQLNQCVSHHCIAF